MFRRARAYHSKFPCRLSDIPGLGSESGRPRDDLPNSVAVLMNTGFSHPASGKTWEPVPQLVRKLTQPTKWLASASINRNAYRAPMPRCGEPLRGRGRYGKKLVVACLGDPCEAESLSTESSTLRSHKNLTSTFPLHCNTEPQSIQLPIC